MGEHNGYMITAPEHDTSFCAVELERTQCLKLLGRAPIARVVLSINCMPVALPVNIAVLGEDAIFSTDSGSKLTAAVEGQVVSVEADEIDLMYRTGWSVLVTGRAQLVTEPADIEWANSHLQAWAPGPHPFLVRVPPTLISGRRLMWDALQDNG
jgi:nitroimidazol reductase NimA-like FMN-containing flavoprotein (pyridoxamine 5'-phosphate oxidase superfamily)